MGHEPNYITAPRKRGAPKVTLFRDAQVSPDMAVQNGQPTPLTGRGFFFARPHRPTRNTFTSEAKLL